MHEAAPYGLLTRINTDGSVSLQAQREANNAQCFELSLNPLGGSVLVGNVVTPKAKLHIEKTALVEYEYNHAGQALGTLYGLGVGTKSYGISMWTEGSGRGFIQQMRFDGATSVYDLCLQPFGGNVAVGRTTADAKLHVGGSIYADYDLVSTGTSKSAGGFNLSDTGESDCGLMPNRLITSSGQATDIWLYNNTKISYYASAHEIFNDVTINGNLLTTGAITANKIYAASSTATSLIEIKVNSDTSIAAFGYENGYGAIIQSYKSGKYFALKDDGSAYMNCGLHVDGNLKISDTIIFANGFQLYNESNSSFGINKNSSTRLVTINDSGIHAFDFVTTSDSRLKDFTKDVEIDFENLKNIPKKYYYWKDKSMGENLQIGTSAQELMKIYPTCVYYNEEEDKYSVNYQKLSIVALAAIDKLHDRVKYLESKIND